MNLEQLEKTNLLLERNLLFLLCKDYGNYNKIKRNIDESHFVCEEYKQVFIAIKNLYDNNGFKDISTTSMSIYCNDKNKDEYTTKYLISFVEMGDKIELDFNGTYNQFKKTNGMFRLLSDSKQYGSMENMLINTYNKSETADGIKNILDTVSKKYFKEHNNANKITSLADGMVEYVTNRMFADDGRSIKFINKYFLQTYSRGIHVGVTFWLGQSGEGKTSLVIPFFSIPILERGQKLLSIHNEQEEDEIRMLYLMSYISIIKKNTEKIYRDNLYSGRRHKITDKQYKYLIQCAREFEERYKGRLEYVFTPRFSPDDLEQLIIEYKREGFDNVLLDTFKQADSNDGWEGLDVLAKKVDIISKDLGMKIICTGQLAPHTKWRKFLTVTCIGKCKSIKEVATSLYFFRWLSREEIPNIKYATFVKNEHTGKPEWKTDMELPLVRLDSNGTEHEINYFVIFNDKQRKAKDGQVIVCEGDLSGLWFKELGITTSIKNDDSGR